jgi:hypothetical protein
MEQLIAITGIVFSNLTFIALIFAWWKSRQRRLELQADVQSRLIDKFASNQEMVAFLQTPAGREFINGVQIGAVAQSREKILAGIRRAIVLMFIGAAFGVLWLMFPRVEIGFAAPALFCFGLGAGNLVAAFVSLNVGRRLGVMEHAANGS